MLALSFATSMNIADGADRQSENAASAEPSLGFRQIIEDATQGNFQCGSAKL
jgi:hypothetical protein